MSQFEVIQKVRNCIKINGGATVKQISMATRIHINTVRRALDVMGDAYIDDWTFENKPIYQCIEVKHEPRPE